MFMSERSLNKIMFIDGKECAYDGERNVLEVLRKAGYDIPTLCYRSDLSVYGACRMCVVEIEGKGVVTSCTIPPEPGMKIRVNTARVRRVRKISLELLLANHHRDCTTCLKSGDCDLQHLANKMGIKDIRFAPRQETLAVDSGNPSIVRDPNKCILCGACVRVCREVQGKNVLDFTHRGSKTVVSPAYNKKLSEVDCTYCGQCVAVCPTGALRVKSDVERVWNCLGDPSKKVIVQVAPAVRVAVAEAFRFPAGTNLIGMITAVLRRLGFDKVFDTTFAADLTIMEEAAEFADRLKNNGPLPLMTSCCPAWVKLVEQKYPQFLENLSSCRSPQQMFGAVAKKLLAAHYGIDRKDLVVVSVMPCTAKKAEARRPEFRQGEQLDVDIVITTQELIKMIKESGIDLRQVKEEPMDLPFGEHTGAGVIFGSSGGVAEAALRTAIEWVTGTPVKDIDIKEVRGVESFKELQVMLNGSRVKVAVVNTLQQAACLLEQIKKGECDYHLIEVMACPGGCIGGAGQPYSIDNNLLRIKRSQGLYEIDQNLPVRKSHENPQVKRLYDEWLKEPNSHLAHELLHTGYHSKRRIQARDVNLSPGFRTDVVEVRVCVGTSCYLRGAYDFIGILKKEIEAHGLGGSVDIKGTFCLEHCGKGPNIMVNGELVHHAVPERAREIFDQYILPKCKKEVG